MQSTFSTRRLVAGTAALFLVILAFLAGRVHAGVDPAQATTSARSTPTSAPDDETERGDDEGDGTIFGIPLPDQGTAPSPGGQDPNPPMTHSS